LRPPRWRNETGTPIAAEAGFSGMGGSRHATSRWAIELPINSPTNEVLSSSIAVSFEYDTGSTKDTLVNTNQYLVKLNYKQ
jgi:hypothetical protein